MLTKTLKFDEPVLEIIRGMEWSNDGHIGKLTCGQLDRKMYVAVNNALAAMGGKWDRRVDGHVFPADPRAAVLGLLDTGAVVVEKDGFFETPRTVIDRMLAVMPMTSGMTILEPSAGLGAIARRLRDKGGEVRVIEKNEYRCAELRKQMFYVRCGDFLNYEITGWDRVYMNPPFEENQDIQHVIYAYGLLKVGGGLVSVMSEGAFFRQDLHARKFQAWMEDKGLSNEKLPEKSFMESGTGVNTRLVHGFRRG